jgi:hypothetical protein
MEVPKVRLSSFPRIVLSVLVRCVLADLLSTLQMLWLKNNMPPALFSSLMFFDLPDWLTYRATNDLARSNCSLACKCSYVPPGAKDSKGWNDEFFEQIGLEEFVCPAFPLFVHEVVVLTSQCNRPRTTSFRWVDVRDRTVSSSLLVNPSERVFRSRRRRSLVFSRVQLSEVQSSMRTLDSRVFD